MSSVSVRLWLHTWLCIVRGGGRGLGASGPAAWLCSARGLQEKAGARHMAWCLTVINLTVMDVRAGVLASVKVNPALWQGPAGEGLGGRRG